MEASFARSILVDAPMAVVAIDGTGTIRSANTTADAFFGQAVAGEPPLNISSLIPELDVAALNAPGGVAALNATSRSIGSGVHLTARRYGGRSASVDVQAARFSAGGEVFLTLFIQDVTDVVAAEAAVQDLRLQITYNWRLNSLGELASMVAHELNQPLSAILNFLDAATTLISRPEIDRAKIIRYVEAAAGQAGRASDVIGRLRTLMSRDTGFHAQTNMAEIVDEILPILNINAREIEAIITVRIPVDGWAHCDRVQIQQVILNLVRNALDAPADGQRRRVLISGGQTDQHYRMMVEDNGPGVPEAVADGLFDPLISTRPGGMGMGLSICRTIVEAHGGSIEHVPSSLGGAGFAFTLNHRNADV